MSLPDVFDPNRAVTEDTVDGLTMPQLMERIQLLNQEAGNTLAVVGIVARMPSVSGILNVLDTGRGQTTEMGIILQSIQRRAGQISVGIDALKK